MAPSGAGNTFGHPTKRALDRLAATGATVYCTQVHGTVLVEMDYASYKVTTLPNVVVRATQQGVPLPTLPLLAAPCAPGR